MRGHERQEDYSEDDEDGSDQAGVSADDAHDDDGRYANPER